MRQEEQWPPCGCWWHRAAKSLSQDGGHPSLLDQTSELSQWSRLVGWLSWNSGQPWWETGWVLSTLPFRWTRYRLQEKSCLHKSATGECQAGPCQIINERVLWEAVCEFWYVCPTILTKVNPSSSLAWQPYLAVGGKTWWTAIWGRIGVGSLSGFGIKWLANHLHRVSGGGVLFAFHTLFISCLGHVAIRTFLLLRDMIELCLLILWFWSPWITD